MCTVVRSGLGSSGQSSIFADRDRLVREAAAIRVRAHFLPVGEDRDVLLRRARHYENAANIDSWVASPGLQPLKAY